MPNWCMKSEATHENEDSGLGRRRLDRRWYLGFFPATAGADCTDLSMDKLSMEKRVRSGLHLL